MDKALRLLVLSCYGEEEEIAAKLIYSDRYHIRAVEARITMPKNILTERLSDLIRRRNWRATPFSHQVCPQANN